MLTPLENWVEKGVAPTAVVATHSTNEVVDRTRPLCPYPQVAKYIGTGSVDEAANFRCEAVTINFASEAGRSTKVLKVKASLVLRLFVALSALISVAVLIAQH